VTRVDIVGLTLAEIALALLFCFVAVFAPSYARATQTIKEMKARPDAVALQKRVDELQLENDKLKAALEGFIRNARSKQTPSCIELGKASGPLFTVTIRGANQYEVDGTSLTLETLRGRFSGELSDATRSKCVHSIRVNFGTDVSAPDYDLALRRIEQSFYTTKLGQRH
jgi:hypothetical protein